MLNLVVVMILILLGTAQFIHIDMGSIQECIWMSTWSLLLTKISALLGRAVCILLLPFLFKDLTIRVFLSKISSMNVSWELIYGIVSSSSILLVQSKDFWRNNLMLNLFLSHLVFTLSYLQMISCLKQMLKIDSFCDVWFEIHICKRVYVRSEVSYKFILLSLSLSLCLCLNLGLFF